MHIVFDQMPDNPLTRKDFFFSILISLMENLIYIGNRPTLKGILDHLPGRFKSADQFGGG